MGKRGRKLSSKQRDEVRDMVLTNIETKHQIYNFNAQGVSTTVDYYPVWSSMFGAQGAAQNDFIGNTVRLQRMRVAGYLTQSDRSNLMRVILIRPTPKYSPITGDTNIFLNNVQPLLSSLDMDFVDRVYFDRLYTLNQGNSVSSQQRLIHHTVNFRNRKLNLTNFADPNQDLYWVVVSDSAVIPHPTFQMTHELQFKDA